MTIEELREFFKGFVTVEPNFWDGELFTLELSSNSSHAILVVLCDSVNELICPDCDFTWGWHRKDCKAVNIFRSATEPASQPTPTAERSVDHK
jgi:hypothetical protein